MRRTRPSRAEQGSELARLILRGALGATMIAHGVRHGRTLKGTAGWFESIGFREPELQARMSSAVEIGAGVGLITGAAVPLSASAVVGTMGVAYATVHRPNGYFVVSEGWEYVGFISASCVALSALGAGRWSVDRLLGLEKAGGPLQRGVLTAGLGIVGALGQLAIFWRKPKP